MNKFLHFLFLTFLFSISPLFSYAQDDKPDYFQYVNPFIGTDAHGHTFPGATLPFGMMQLSPDTRLRGWDGCSGYHYSDEYIYGFSHTHLSGTGVSDYGDILLMPTNKVVFNNGENGEEGYRAKFSHERESAHAGYYSVYLETTDIDVELTTSLRSGIHKYQFPSSENQYIILDLEHRDELLNHAINMVDDYTISGLRFSKAWATDQRVFFHFELSHPIEDFEFSEIREDLFTAPTPTKVAIKLNNPDNEPVIIKIGISPVDIEGAKRNMLAEIGDLTFAEAKKAAEGAWNKELQKIRVEGASYSEMVELYTAMYHLMIAPNLYQDVDGRYRGMDMEVHRTTDFKYYTVFSLWDTYRATHPLFTIIDEERTTDFIKTFLAKYKEGGIMPIWDLSACYTGCMIGYHGVSVIADAYIKGIRDYDTELAMEAMRHSATRDYLGLESYKKYGFIAIEKESESVSKTLEYAYDDWAIAQMADAMGKADIYEKYIRRAQYYKNQFDPSVGFMRGRFMNRWFTPFDPYEVNNNFTEGNSWQYSYYVPQDISGLAKLHGGKQAFAKYIDGIFNADTEITGRKQVDITGMVGQYAHGNEPSQQIAYMYNYVNQPWKAQEYVKHITSTLYSDAPDGIAGNEDCGQLSAWYIFSTLGFYPVTPGSDMYIIGTPHYKRASLHLENGNTFTITAENVSDSHFYIASARLNGKDYRYSYLRHEDIMKGGELHFVMSDKPTDWATQDEHVPVSSIDEYLIVPVPYIESGELTFGEETEVVFNTVDAESIIYYSLDGDSFRKYESPILLSNSTEISVFAKRGDASSAVFTTNFSRRDANLTLELGVEYANQYSAGGDEALIDGLYGSVDHRTGTWQGYHYRDFVATLKMKESRYLDSLSLGFLQDQRSWIFFPTEVKIYISEDGESYKEFSELKMSGLERDDDNKVKRPVFAIGKEVKGVKIVAGNAGKLPSWHLGYEYDGKTWIFVDEITIYERK